MQTFDFFADTERRLELLEIALEAPMAIIDSGAVALVEGMVAHCEESTTRRTLKRVLSKALDEYRQGRNGAVHELQFILATRWHDSTRAVVAERLAPGGRALFFVTADTAADIADDARIGGGVGKRDEEEFVVRRIDPQIVSVRRVPKIPHVVLLPDPADSVSQIRTLGPMELLERRGRIRLTVLGDKHDGALVRADLLVLQRFGGLSAFELQCRANMLAIPVALDLDDDFFHLPWFNPSAAAFKAFDQRIVLNALVRGSDRIIVSTPGLGDAVSELNDDVWVQHNLVDTQQFVRHPPAKAGSAVVTFGYIGTNTHLEDLRPVVEPLRELLEEANGAVRAVFIGNLPEALRYSPHVEYRGWFNSYRSAAAALSRSGVSVALAPLLDLTFNRSKSAMKYLEYGACGIPGLFSNAGTYASFVRHLENGYLVDEHSPAAWSRALRFVIDNPDAIQRMATSAYEDVRANHSTQQDLESFYRPYASLIDDSRRRQSLPASPSPDAQESAQPPTLSVVIRPSATPAQALAELKQTRELVGADAQLIVVSPSLALCRLVNLSGEAEAIWSLSARGEKDSLAGVAMAKARGEWVLWLSGPNCSLDSFPADSLSEIGNSSDDVFAIGPSLLDPVSVQGLHRLVGEGNDRGISLTRSKAAIRGGAGGSNPTETGYLLSGDCVLLHRQRACDLEVDIGGLNWDDAVQSLCLSASENGLRSLVANEWLVRGRFTGESECGAQQASVSRSRLWKRTHRALESVRSLDTSTRVEIATLEPTRLGVFVLARDHSPYLGECLSRIERYSRIPLTVSVFCHRRNTDARAVAKRRGARVLTISSTQPSGIRAALTDCAEMSHALLLHDGVMLTSGAIRQMLFVSRQSLAAVVVPMTDDGSPAQCGFEEPPSGDYAEVDTVASRVVVENAGGWKTVANAAMAAALIDLSVVRNKPNARCLLELGAESTTLAIGAYVRLLSHPGAPGPWGRWEHPGGPFDLSSQALSECRRIEQDAPSDSVMRQLNLLLATHRLNRLDARILAKLGGLLVLCGEVERGFVWIDNALRMDPFSYELAHIDSELRRHLGNLCRRDDRPMVTEDRDHPPIPNRNVVSSGPGARTENSLVLSSPTR